MITMSDRLSGKIMENDAEQVLPSSTSNVMKDEVNLSDKFPTGFFSNEEMKNFRLDELLGEGSFGCAYKAPTGIVYVVKTLTKTGCTKDLLEAKIGMEINHLNVCKTYAWSEDAYHFYIIMEFIDGKDLFEFISKNQGIFQKNTSLFWFMTMNILHGLAAIHQKRFVHFDIKPENIMIGLSPDGKTITSVKIIDFGLSRPDGEIQQCRAGTRDYMAPEVAKGTYKDARLDIWSFSILMYAMFMTGFPTQIHSRNPDDNLRKAEIIQNLCSLTTDGFKPFTRISSQEKYARIQNFIMSCLRVNQIERPSS
jgi:serine/threonine protein kinase